MKFAVMFLTSVFVLSGHAYAQDKQLDDCGGWYEFASTTMRMRQDGVPFHTMLESLDVTRDAADIDPRMADFANEIVKQAYLTPLAETERMARVVEVEYAEYVWGICVRQQRPSPDMKP